jgi:CheY-like chemotaxis protein
VLDLLMPQMNGQAVLRELRSFAPKLPVILSSGYTEEHETAARLAAEGPTGFLPKPYRPAELLEKVRQVLVEQPTAVGGSGS